MSPPPRRRRLLLVAGATATAGTLGVGVLASVNLMARRTVHTERAFAFAGSHLDVRAPRGDVTVVPGPPGRITVFRSFTSGLRAPDMTAAVHGSTFVMRDGGCGPAILTPCRDNWTVAAPRSVSVTAVTGNGSIRVTGRSGDVELTSGAGRIVVDGGSGKLELASGSGAVTAAAVGADEVRARSVRGPVSLTFARDPGFVLAHTDSGPITVVLPSDGARYRVAPKVLHDGTVAGAYNNDPNSHRVIALESTQGNIVIQAPVS